MFFLVQVIRVQKFVSRLLSSSYLICLWITTYSSNSGITQKKKKTKKKTKKKGRQGSTFHSLMLPFVAPAR